MWIASLEFSGLKNIDATKILLYKSKYINNIHYDYKILKWNVIIGNNGNGKTSILQLIAYLFMDFESIHQLSNILNWTNTSLNYEAKIEIPYKKNSWITYKSKSNQSKEKITKMLNNKDNIAYSENDDNKDQITHFGNNDTNVLLQNIKSKNSGFLICGYGPFHRSTGSIEIPFHYNIFALRFITLFQEGAALFDCEQWLKELERKSLKSQEGSSARKDFTDVMQTLPTLLPGISKIEIEDDVRFYYMGTPHALNSLSDGYRSMFVLVADILRWALIHRSDENCPVNEVPGVVLIDEVDAHLHPRWQREVGRLLTTAFPNIQFIVTTHSPFVAMSAEAGGLTVLRRREDGTIYADQDVPSPMGWSVDRVLEEIFGMTSLTDPDTAAKLEEYEQLRLARAAPTPEQAARLDALEALLNRRMYGNSDAPEAKKRERDNAFLEQLLAGGSGAPPRTP